jgi:PAS domain S-box-containing protein
MPSVQPAPARPATPGSAGADARGAQAKAPAAPAEPEALALTDGAPAAADPACPQGPSVKSPRHSLQVLWETSLDALLVVDDERRYVFVNGPAEELLGAPREEIYGRRIQDFTPRKHWPFLDRLWADFEQRGHQYGQYEVEKPDGSRALIEYRARRQLGPGRHLIVARPLTAQAQTTPAGSGDALTSRERQILQLAADGKSTRDIADALVISPATVKRHFERIYSRLSARDRTHAVALGLRHGLIV